MKSNKGGKKGASKGSSDRHGGKWGGGKSSGASKGSGRGGTPLACAMKFLASEGLVSAVIGKSGSVISAIRTECEVRISLTEHNECFPKTDCRVITVQAEKESNLDEASQRIIAKVVEVTGADPEQEGAHEFRLRAVVPSAAGGGIIGKGGANIKQLREATGAKISIEDPIGSGPGADQVVSVSGSSQALEDVMKEVNKQVQLYGQTDWFSSWASNPGCSSGWDESSYGGSYGDGYGGAHHKGLGMLWDTAAALPPYVLDDERGFTMSCIVPNRLCGGMIGKGGSGTKEIQSWTGTKISFREVPDDPDNRSLNITGPLASTNAAYMMMMKRYLDAEASSSTREPE